MGDHLLADSYEDEDIDIVTMIEQFKLGLISRATGGSLENKDYVRMRKVLLGNTDISHLIPQFLKSCRNTDEYWQYY
jgi:hypothetical protein